MLDRIRTLFRDVRIDLDFPRYDRQQHSEHESQAKRRFSTEQLNFEKEKLLEKIESRANSKFNSSIHEKESDKKQNEEAARETEYYLSFFLRNYKKELNDLYAKKDGLLSKKKELYDDLSEIKCSLFQAFDDKNNAYSKLNHYKNRIDSWYAKSGRSPWLLGNAGKQLPKHSLFGQSIGDLDSYKYHRDSAYDDVLAAKSKIGDLKQNQHDLHRAIRDIKEEIGDVFSQIDQAKEDRSRMRELKSSGYQRNKLKDKLCELRKTIGVLVGEIEDIFKCKNEFINQEKDRHGVVELEAKIRKIESEKEQFLNSFYSEESKQHRKRAHREIWLEQRGMA